VKLGIIISFPNKLGLIITPACLWKGSKKFGKKNHTNFFGGP
jgi:hypothetical protein